MNKYLRIACFLLLMPGRVFGDASLDSLAFIKAEFTFFTTDNLGMIYGVRKDNSIEKYNPQGKLLNQLNNKVYGKCYSIDASNPFELYLFYKDANKIVFTDNQLTNRGLIDLNNSDFLQASAIARSYDNGIWIFDQSDLQLKKFNKQLELKQQSGNVLQFVKQQFNANAIADQENKVFVYNEGGGFELFDVFASHLQSLPFSDVKAWQVRDDNLFYLWKEEIWVYNFLSLESKRIRLPESGPLISFRLSGEYLFLLEETGLRVFKGWI